MAHFFVVISGSKIHERVAHFFIDIYNYENTVFEVVSLELKSRTENEISFSVCVSKGGIVQEPDRTIFLEFVNGHWKVVNEGY